MIRSARALLSAAIFVAIASAASAADLPRPTYQSAPIAFSDRVDWTGFYVGGNIGYGWARNTSVSQNIKHLGSVVQDSAPQGGLGGAQIGARFELANRIVLGAELAGSFANMTGSAISQNSLSGFIPVRTESNTRLGWLASATGSVGYAFDNWLLYGKGGYAMTRISQSGASDIFGFQVASFDRKFTTSGWTAGGGVEYRLNKNWSIGAEFDHYDFAGKDFTVGTGFFGKNVNVQNGHIPVNVGLLKVNYNF